MALEHGNEHALHHMELAIDPTQRPPDNLRTALCSCICCPLVAFAAVWHSRAVHAAWDAGLFNRARAHAIMVNNGRFIHGAVLGELCSTLLNPAGTLTLLGAGKGKGKGKGTGKGERGKGKGEREGARHMILHMILPPSLVNLVPWQSKKLSSSAVLYGILILVFYVFGE